MLIYRINGGQTALMYASENGHADVVNKLLAKGANVNLQDKGWQNSTNNSITIAAYRVIGSFLITVQMLI
ncbi:MAG: ankyrin repeat domain-containing protein [Alphaproteobacteria bacterium]|nr:MAG: ankyrin repeat domain-containing protein [Alphaproteobacteria bacterium]